MKLEKPIGEDEHPTIKANGNAFVQLDWKRRFDHMQQHSGEQFAISKLINVGNSFCGNFSAQHLLTAMADGIFGFVTTSWWLGHEYSYVELGDLRIIITKHAIL
jgi:Ser-tRNA(Ala) deacylase AlaX